VMLADGSGKPAMHEVRLADGSVLLADALAVIPGLLRIRTPSLGELTATAEQVLQIAAGPARQQPLVDLKPAQVQGDAGQFAIDALPSGLPMRLGGRQVPRGISLGAGASISYDLGAEYRVLLMRVGVPEGVLPANPVRLIIIADGDELYRGPPRTSLDEPQSITLGIGGVRRLRITVEAELAGPVGASMLLGEPSLVK
jgi:hypothetical protein